MLSLYPFLLLLTRPLDPAPSQRKMAFPWSSKDTNELTSTWFRATVLGSSYYYYYYYYYYQIFGSVSSFRVENKVAPSV
jgi:hypothetical protein